MLASSPPLISSCSLLLVSPSCQDWQEIEEQEGGTSNLSKKSKRSKKEDCWKEEPEKQGEAMRLNREEAPKMTAPKKSLRRQGRSNW